MTPEYVAFWPGASPADVLTAQAKHFPRRATWQEAFKDVQAAWHNPGHWDTAVHLTLFQIDGDYVTELAVRVKRGLEVEVAK